MSVLDQIQAQVSCKTRLEQLAEECCELAHAALKVVRCISTDNPTPISLEEAYANLKEEAADVRLMLELVGCGADVETELAKIATEKARRWIERLEHEKVSTCM